MDGACIAWDSLEGWDGVGGFVKGVAGGCIMSSPLGWEYTVVSIVGGYR